VEQKMLWAAAKIVKRNASVNNSYGWQKQNKSNVLYEP
jgi:hypothetical protein